MYEDILFRQVHPKLFENGLSSAAFRPNTNDNNQLSVDCGNMTSARLSYELHLQKTKPKIDGTREPLQTAGVWGIKRATCSVEGLPVVADPIKDEEHQPDNPAHHLVNFASPEEKVRKDVENIAKRLKIEALTMGRLWPPG